MNTHPMTRPLLTLLLVLGMLATTSAQTSILLQPIRDNTLYEDSTGTEANGSGDYFFAGRVGLAGDGALRRGLVAFDVAGAVPPGAIILDARLRLTMNRTISGATDVGIHPVTADWAEGATDAVGQEGIGDTRIDPEATWLHRVSPTTLWTTPGGDFNPVPSAVTSVAGIGTYTWTSPAVLADVISWRDNPATNFGWLIQGDETVVGTAKRFGSREGAIADRPILDITYVVPVVVDVSADKDNTLYQDTTGSLSNGAGAHFFAGQSSDSDLKRGVIAFAVAGALLPGATVVDVELILNMSRSGVGAKDVALHRLITDWGEAGSDAGGNEGGGAAALPGDATWTHAFTPTDPWATTGGDFQPVASATQSVVGVGSYTWNDLALTADVQDMLDNPGSNYGWLLHGDESGGRSSKRFDSRQNPTPANRPILRVWAYGGIDPCPVVMTGDVDLSSTITSADIIYLVNFVFKGGPGPQPCDAAGDVTCDGNVTSADIIYLVNFVFKGDQAPCDVCDLIPGTWTCP